MEKIGVLDSENRAVADKRPNAGLTRKKLADISNISRQPNTSVQNDIEQLKKENMGLVKLLVDKNKIIDLTGRELQKLRAILQKMQLQNQQLAQSNSLMLAELNSGKDTLKTLHHELCCKNSLIQVLRSELEAKVLTSPSKNEVDETKPLESEQLPSKVDTENKLRLEPETKIKLPCHRNRRQRSTSMATCTTTTIPQSKETAENKRPCVRRQSARFRGEEPTSDAIEEAKAPRLSPSMVDDQIRGEDGSNYRRDSSSAVDEEENIQTSSASLPCHQVQEFERLSFGGGRPSRQAAKKINSYKEIPVNVKMRRTT